MSDERYGTDACPIYARPHPGAVSGIGSRPGAYFLSARRITGAAQVMEMIEESRYSLEWTAGEIAVDQAAELVDIQVMLTVWKHARPEAQASQSQRTLLSLQARKWSDQVLGYSGLGKE